jgi:RND family efflux transporter MFP subunit
MKKPARTLLYRFTLLLAITASLPGCDQPQQNAVSEVTRPAKTIIVGAAEATRVRNFPGVIDANQKAQLAFRVAGKLQSLPVRESELVEQGQVIAQLDPTDFEIVLSSRVASYEESKANFERAEKLLPKGHISKSDYDHLEAAYKNATAALADARQQLKYTTLRAPFAGQVAMRLVENFEEVQAKQVIVELQDISSLEVKVDLSEREVKRIRDTDTKPDIFANFDVAPGQRFPLTVKEYATVADPQTQTFRLTLAMDRPDSIRVLPGMTTSVSVHLAPGSNGSAEFMIPISAIASDINGKPQVWRVDEATMTVHPQPVKVGQMHGHAMVVYEGIQTGDRLVTAGVAFLSEGQSIRLMPEVEQAEAINE